MVAEHLQVDIAILGAGTAGMGAYSAATRAGARAVLIDPGPLGTTCARVGCMPSKAVLRAGQRWHALRDLMPAGMTETQWRASLPAGHTTPQAMWSEALALRDGLVEGNIRQLRKLAGDDLLAASAHFVDAHTVALSDGRRVQAKAFVVATGSTPHVPPELREQLGDALITTDDLFDLHELPRSVAVMGLGAIGMEMGIALHQLGVQVLGIGRSAVVGGVDDPEVAQAASTYFAGQMPLALGEKAPQFQRNDSGVLVQAGGQQLQAQYVLAAVGRRPRTEGLNLQAAGVQMDAKGRPQWDAATLRYSGTHVFVAGDATGDNTLFHEALHEGRMAAQQALAAVGKADANAPQRMVPISVLFSHPDVAQVGARFSELPADAVVGTATGQGSGRSKVMAAPHHMLRLYADRSSRQLLGATVFSEGGEHMAHALAWAIQRGETVDSMLELPYYHPCLEEMIETALKDLRRALRA